MNITNDTDDEAAQWAARILSEGMTSDDIDELRAWRNASEENRTALDRYGDVLAMTDKLEFRILSEEFENELHDTFARSHGVKTQRMWSAIAVSIAVLVAAISGYFLANRDTGVRQYASSGNEQRLVRLDDGSSVLLNMGSKVSVVYSAHKRKISLERGEALFDVKSIAERPFVVSTNLAIATVAGTVFSIRSLPDETVVRVISGEVQVGGAHSKMQETFTAGEVAVVDKAGQIIRADFDPTTAL